MAHNRRKEANAKKRAQRELYEATEEELEEERQDAAARLLQGLYRAKRARRIIRELVKTNYLKIYDPEFERYFYKNKKTGATSWTKPTFFGSDDIEPQEFYHAPESWDPREPLCHQVAFVCTVDTYASKRIPDIHGSLRVDHQELEKVLTHPYICAFGPEHCTFLHNCTRDAFLASIAGLKAIVEQYECKSLLVIMQTHMTRVSRGGHKGSYFMMADSNWNSTSMAAQTSVSLKEFCNTIREIECDHKTVVLDVAHNLKPMESIFRTRFLYPPPDLGTVAAQMCECPVIMSASIAGPMKAAAGTTKRGARDAGGAVAKLALGSDETALKDQPPDAKDPKLEAQGTGLGEGSTDGDSQAPGGQLVVVTDEQQLQQLGADQGKGAAQTPQATTTARKLTARELDQQIKLAKQRSELKKKEKEAKAKLKKKKRSDKARREKKRLKELKKAEEKAIKDAKRRLGYETVRHGRSVGEGTLFGRVLVEALKGAATKQGTLRLTLEDLFAYLQTEVIAGAKKQQALQTPVLSVPNEWAKRIKALPKPEGEAGANAEENKDGEATTGANASDGDGNEGEAAGEESKSALGAGAAAASKDDDKAKGSERRLSPLGSSAKIHPGAGAEEEEKMELESVGDDESRPEVDESGEEDEEDEDSEKMTEEDLQALAQFVADQKEYMLISKPESITICQAPSPPPAPMPPVCVKSGYTTLTIRWTNPKFSGVPPMRYQVQMKGTSRVSGRNWVDVMETFKIVREKVVVPHMVPLIMVQFRVRSWNYGGWGRWSDASTLMCAHMSARTLTISQSFARALRKGPRGIIKCLRKFEEIREAQQIGLQMLATVGAKFLGIGVHNVHLGEETVRVAMKAMSIYSIDGLVLQYACLCVGWGCHRAPPVAAFAEGEGAAELIGAALARFPRNVSLAGAASWARGNMDAPGGFHAQLQRQQLVISEG
mmetsp:Transcript_31265/g.99336  ORF Transcript_31265/g.99336 Transcript_31265/m.99336 type:complete len:944 (-) Transcript_31265:177-3008(-)